MTHDQIIKAITSATFDVPGIKALFLSGSYGNGLADKFSDIDFVLVADEGATDAVAGIWRNAIEQTGEIVLWWDRNTVPVLINAITEDWTRTDVIILKPDQTGSQTRNSLKPLFDHDGIYDGLAEVLRNAGPNLAKTKY